MITRLAEEERLAGAVARVNRLFAGQAADYTSLDAEGQNADTAPDRLPPRPGRDQQALSSQRADLHRRYGRFPGMNRAWDAWLDRSHKPARATVRSNWRTRPGAWKSPPPRRSRRSSRAPARPKRMTPEMRLRILLCCSSPRCWCSPDPPTPSTGSRVGRRRRRARIRAAARWQPDLKFALPKPARRTRPSA